MSHPDPGDTAYRSTIVPDEPETDQLPEVDADPRESDDLHDVDELDDLDEEWVSTAGRPGIRVRLLTGLLVVLVAAAAGFYGGVILQKHHGTSSSSVSALASRFAAARAGGRFASRTGTAGGTGTGGTGTGAGATGTGSATIGIVTEVQGQTLYITDSSGNLVKVTLTPQSAITKSSAIAATGLLTGDTVVVRGTAGADGSVTATAVTDGPAAALAGGTSVDSGAVSPTSGATGG